MNFITLVVILKNSNQDEMTIFPLANTPEQWGQVI